MQLGVEQDHPRQGPRLRAAEHRRRGPRDRPPDRRLEDLRHLRRDPSHGRVRRLHRASGQEGRPHYQVSLPITPALARQAPNRSLFSFQELLNM